MHFQGLISALESFWAAQGCAILHPYDMEMGAGTFHPATTLRSLGPGYWRAAYVQPSRRPTDGRYGDNPNRVGRHHQFQVIMKPAPVDVQSLYLKSLESIGIDTILHDIRFVEDDWESPTLGAAGLGWEVWCDGMEVTQFTYFQQMGGFECNPVPVELTYGLERLAMMLGRIDNVYKLNWNGEEGDKKITWGDVYFQSEYEFSHFNFNDAPVDMLFQHFNDVEKACYDLLDKGLVLPAYDYCLKASHMFNLLDARGVISVMERAAYIARVRAMASKVCALWLKGKESTSHPQETEIAHG